MKKFVRTVLAVTVVLLMGIVFFGGSVGAKSGELEPASDRVIFIKDPPAGYGNTELTGDGSGKDADNPLKITPHKDYDQKAENSKGYLNTLLYQATEALAETGGTIVICGEVALNDVSLEAHKNKFKTAEFGDKTIKFTSVYGGVDYRKENGAKLLINTSSGMEIYGNTVWENIDLVTDGMFRNIYFNGYPALMDTGVNCYPRDSAFEEVYSAYISLYGGSRGGKTLGVVTDVTVRSGKYCIICGGDYGSVVGTYMENAETNLTLEGTTEVIGAVYGASKMKNGKFSGNVNITVNDGVYPCELFGIGPAGLENKDGKLTVTINGGDFEDAWCVSVMFETDDEVTLPRYSLLDLRNYSSDETIGLAYIYNVIDDLAEGHFTEVLFQPPEDTHPPICDPYATDTTEDTSVSDTEDITSATEPLVEETSICYGDNLSQEGTSQKEPNENNGTKNIIAVIAVAAAAVVAVAAVVVAVSKKKTK